MKADYPKDIFSSHNNSLIISIRGYRRHDIEEISLIEKASFTAPWSKEAFIKEIASPYSHAMIAEGVPVNDNGHLSKKAFRDASIVVGYIFFTAILGEAYIKKLAVHPSYRRQGIGCLLLNEVLRLVKKQDIDKVILDCDINNRAAFCLYKKMGFKASSSLYDRGGSNIKNFNIIMSYGGETNGD